MEHVRVERLDYLGVIASVIKDLGLIDLIDTRLVPDAQERITSGDAVAGMTRDQLEASVKDPWTRTTVGLGFVAADAGRAEIAPPKITAAVTRPATQVRMEIGRNIVASLGSRK